MADGLWPPPDQTGTSTTTSFAAPALAPGSASASRWAGQDASKAPRALRVERVATARHERVAYTRSRRPIGAHLLRLDVARLQPPRGGGGGHRWRTRANLRPRARSHCHRPRSRRSGSVRRAASSRRRRHRRRCRALGRPRATVWALLERSRSNGASATPRECRTFMGPSLPQQDVSERGHGVGVHRGLGWPSGMWMAS